MSDSGAAADSGDNGAVAWDAGFDDAARGFVENKGWAGPGDMLTSYQNLEKFQGGSKNLIEIPGEGADDAAHAAYLTALGRPATVEDYKFTEVPDGSSPELEAWFRQAAFDAGLSGERADAMFKGLNTWGAEQATAQNDARAAEEEADIAAVKKEWGAAYEQNLSQGKQAVAALGYDEASLSALEEQMGTGEMLKLFAKVGSVMGEPAFHGDTGGGGQFTKTAEAAKHEISDLKLDEKFMAKYLDGDKDAMAKMTKLTEVAYGS